MTHGIVLLLVSFILASVAQTSALEVCGLTGDPADGAVF